MIEQIPEDDLDVFEKPAVANVATALPDGSQHITPAWLRPTLSQTRSMARHQGEAGLIEQALRPALPE